MELSRTDSTRPQTHYKTSGSDQLASCHLPTKRLPGRISFIMIIPLSLTCHPHNIMVLCSPLEFTDWEKSPDLPSNRTAERVRSQPTYSNRVVFGKPGEQLRAFLVGCSFYAARIYQVYPWTGHEVPFPYRNEQPL